MKTLAILLVTVAAVSAQQAPLTATLGQGAAAGAAAAPAAGAGTPGAAGGAGGLGFIDYGPKVYGMGAKNPIAFPPNPFEIQRAIAIANSIPKVLVRLDIDGDVTLTNEYGQEVDVVDAFGREIEY